MHIDNIKEGLASFTPSHIDFPKNPTVVNINGHDVYEYVQVDTLDKLIRNMSDHVNLNWFDIVYYNEKGGRWLKNKLIDIQTYNRNILACEYHPDGRIPMKIAEEHKNLKVAVIDDVRDTRRTTDFIRNDAPNTTFIYIARKMRGDQVNDPLSIHAMDLDDVWLGGAGMNLETKGDGLPTDFLRNEPAIYVKIPKRINPTGVWVY